MNVNIKMKPISIIKIRLGINANGRVQRFATNTCYKHMDKYVPYQTGFLRENVDIDYNKIFYNTLYAHYQYIGLSKKGNKLNYKTPGTGSYWDKKMVSAEMVDVVKEIQDYVNGGA